MSYQFHIQLMDILDPVVWRRVSVPEQFTFYRFHRVIQAAFGWKNAHLFEFSPDRVRSYPVIGVPDPGWDEEPIMDSKKAKLSDFFSSPMQKFTYLYDFGDYWIHAITLEKVTEEKALRAYCIAGDGACLPEDCGGSRGYASFKEILRDPNHPEFLEMMQWVGLTKSQNWDKGHFNLEKTRVAVQKI
ncbi:MAG: plasmid pRiA4b ORF-3 family protein [Bacteroidota bacterium]|nr:plasmid pRiA4b ORF-3 family protein [Bacteroidota bacterium]